MHYRVLCRHDRVPSSGLCGRVLRAGFLALTLCIGLIGVGHAQVSQSRIGVAIYTAPRGWRQLSQSGTAEFFPPHLAANEGCLLAILQDQSLHGSFRAWFDKAIKASLSGGERVVKDTQVMADHTGDGSAVLYTLKVAQDSKGQRSYRFYFAVHPGNRVVLILYFATSQTVFQRYQQSFINFVNTLHFTNVKPGHGHGHSMGSGRTSPSPAPTVTAPAPVVPAPAATPTPQAQPAPAPSGLSGLYVAEKSYSQFNPVTGFYDYIIRRYYYLFYPDGRVYAGLPSGGLDAFDFAQAQQNSPANAGQYSVGDGQIQFQWSDGSSGGPYAITDNGSNLHIGSLTYYQVQPDDGLQLDGTYTSSSFVNTSGGGQESGVSGNTTIVFSPDGQFNAQNFVGYAGSGSAAGGTASLQGTGSGMYSLSGNTLTLSYSDGSSARFTFFVYPGSENGAHPGLILIDGAPFLPQ